MVSDPRSKGGYVLVSLFQGMVQSRLLRHAIDRPSPEAFGSNLHTESREAFVPRALSKYELEFPGDQPELQS